MRQHGDHDSNGRGHSVRSKRTIRPLPPPSKGRASVDRGLSKGQPPLEQKTASASASASASLPIRTGCVPCLSKGIRCDPSNPSCARSVNSQWPSHQRRVVTGQGALIKLDSHDVPFSLYTASCKSGRQTIDNWKDRSCFHHFVQYTAPQIAGLFHSDFWQRDVIVSAYSDASIMHALIAMGSLHQATLQALGRSETRTDTPAFALRHINNSIRAVTDPEPNLHKLLSICAIYSTFEAMQGRSNDAISHILQGQKLLALMSGATQEPNALPIHTLNVVHITTQLGSIAYGMTEVPAPFQMPEPTPIPATFPSIEKADCCLRYARSAILTLCLCIYARESSPQALVALEQKQSVYAPYLLRWETSFAKLLAGNGAKLADFDRKRAMILKANHLHLSVLASVDNRQGLRAYRPFERHYRAIVELSKAVLGAWGTLPLPTVAPFERPWISYGMWLTEPLYTVMTRSHGVELQEEARRLLQRHPPQQAILGLAPDAHDKGELHGG